jgi:iron complex outermembrane recepter protein
VKQNIMKTSLRLAVAPAVLGMALFSTGAVAQETEGAESGSDAVIVVTGSRIRKDEFSATEPLTLITKNEITGAGFNSAAEALQSNQVTQGSSQINNYYAGFVTDGGTGANTLSLRGLGATRTLILLNGRRLAPAGTRGAVGSVDTNVLPTAIVDRIEVLKAGASSIYGSDAVAGVVNIITDTKLDGLVLEGQVTVPEVGEGVDHRISGSFGYSGDKFHVLTSVDYFKRNKMARNDVAWTKCPIAGYLTGVGTEFGSGDYVDPTTGKPACFTLDNGGVTINTLGVPSRQAVNAATGANGSFNRLRPNASITTGNTPGFVGVSYYTRDTFDPRQEEEELVTPAEVWTGFVQAGYDIDALGDAEIYTEVLVNQRKSSSTLYRQLSLDYAQGSLLVPEIFRNGAFLNANEISNGKVVAARAFIGFGNTKSSQDVDFARISGGVRGKFLLPGWRYDAYASKSWVDADYFQESFLTDRVAKSLDVVQNTDGTFRCATTSDPKCVAAPPLNAATIGGNLPQAYKDYILANVMGTTKFRESTLSLNLDGPVFRLPGGETQVALGAEYRSSSINDTPPVDSINSNLYSLTSATPTRGSDKVWEVFGEAYLPILANVPFAYRFNVDMSARYTHYDSYGGQETYKVAANWEPIRGFGFRASYGTSYRAPALFEQFLGATSGFVASSSDPCDDYANKTNATIKANCAAIGLPADFTQKSSIKALTGGGASSGLAAETSKNFSAGMVFNPVLPEKFGTLSVALDYFSIQVDNGVARLSTAAILNLCYSNASFNVNEGYCRLVHRDANFNLTVDNNYVNLSTDKVSGWEFNLRYARDIGPGKLTFNALVTKYQEQSSRLFPTDPLIDANGTITSPDWTGTFDASYRVGKFRLRWGMDWVAGDHNKTYEYIVRGSDGTVDPDDLAEIKDGYFYEVDDYFLHNLSLQVDLGQFEVTAGVKNLLDTKPPAISTADYSRSPSVVGNAPLYSGYDYVGRRFFVNGSIKF